MYTDVATVEPQSCIRSDRNESVPETTRSSHDTHYCVIRSDLPRGILAAQLVHAAGESSLGNIAPDTAAVVLSVPSEDALKAIQRRLAAAGVDHREIHESVGPYAGQFMAIGVRPGPREEVRRHLSSLPLLK